MSSNKKTIILLIAVVAIIVCVAYIMMNQIKTTGIEDITTKLLQIQAKTKNLMDKSIADNNEELIIGQNVPEVLAKQFNLNNVNETKEVSQENVVQDVAKDTDETEEENVEKTEEKAEAREKEQELIRILSIEDLKTLGLSNIKEDMKYIVNYTTGEVYYVDGVQDEKGDTHYKLSEMNTITQEKE